MKNTIAREIVEKNYIEKIAFENCQRRTHAFLTASFLTIKAKRDNTKIGAFQLIPIKIIFRKNEISFFLPSRTCWVTVKDDHTIIEDDCNFI